QQTLTSDTHPGTTSPSPTPEPVTPTSPENGPANTKSDSPSKPCTSDRTAKTGTDDSRQDSGAKHVEQTRQLLYNRTVSTNEHHRPPGDASRYAQRFTSRHPVGPVTPPKGTPDRGHHNIPTSPTPASGIPEGKSCHQRYLRS